MAYTLTMKLSSLISYCASTNDILLELSQRQASKILIYAKVSLSVELIFILNPKFRCILGIDFVV